jgi:hypothetical protein
VEIKEEYTDLIQTYRDASSPRIAGVKFVDVGSQQSMDDDLSRKTNLNRSPRQLVSDFCRRHSIDL